MSITNGYATLAQIKNRLNITSTSDDTMLEEAVESASREVDNFCGRRFYADAAATARVFYPVNGCRVLVDDFYDLASLQIAVDNDDDGVYETLLSGGYVLKPLNGVVDGEAGWPYWKIDAVGGLSWPTWSGRPPIQVTAKWGWSAVPKPVYQATLLVATANYKLKDVAFGTAGVGDIGTVTVRDVPAARAKLGKYQRDPVKAA